RRRSRGVVRPRWTFSHSGRCPAHPRGCAEYSRWHCYLCERRWSVGNGIAGAVFERRGRKAEDFLDGRIFNRAAVELKAPETRDVAGFNSYLERFRHGLPLEDAAVATMPIEN